MALKQWHAKDQMATDVNLDELKLLQQKEHCKCSGIKIPIEM